LRERNKKELGKKRDTCERGGGGCGGVLSMSSKKKGKEPETLRTTIFLAVLREREKKEVVLLRGKGN